MNENKFRKDENFTKADKTIISLHLQNFRVYIVIAIPQFTVSLTLTTSY